MTILGTFRIRRAWVSALAGSIVVLVSLIAAPGAEAVTCPNPVAVVNENQCQGPGSTAWRTTNVSAGVVAGFATEPSVNLGSSVTLKIGRANFSGSRVDISVFRIGYYGGTGGRLVHSAPNVAVNNTLTCRGLEATGRQDCDNWSPTYTIPAAALPASGLYVAKIRTTDTGNDNQIIFVVRDDARPAQMLMKLPTATFQAYNRWTNKSLYDYNSQGANSVSGSRRAVKVAYDRPYWDVQKGDNWFMKSNFAMVYWLERQGYDIAYTESTAVDTSPSSLLNHEALVVSGHDEYWSAAEVAAFKAARAAGVNIASFSSNTAYWKIRYEDSHQTIVCYKTVQGNGTDGSVTPNDPGPDGVTGTADDALGADGIAGTGDDKPQNATTSFRDNGAPPGDPNAPAGGRVGPDDPENSLWGNMYVGDHDSVYFPLVVPAGNGAGEYAADRVWRNSGVATGSSTSIAGGLVGWEWDAIPTQAQYVAKQPAGVKRLTESPTANGSSNWLQDEGRTYAKTPPPGQPGSVQAVKYRATSGALVFSAGTNQWSWGLGPHWITRPGTDTYQQAPTDTSDPRVQQATYNIFSDMGVQPNTPAGIIVDGGNQPPEASFTATPNPVQAGATVTFDGSGSSDPDGSIAKYEWDLDGDGTYETDTGATKTVTRAYAASGAVTVRLRVTDNGGATATATRTVTVGGAANGPYAQAVLGTSGLKSYWRMGETSGSTLIDAAGGSNATLSGGPTLGVPGALSGDGDPAVRFDGINDAGFAPLDLFSTSKVTVEFWLKWNAYANDDRLAMEFTSNFNQVSGGFLVDPNAPQDGGKFGVAIGIGASRNNVFFTRPSAGQWHHYALVLDSAAAAAAQITPYVDGQAVAYTKTASGTGAGNFANSTLNFMSRNGSSLFGGGDLDELALYGSALPAATVQAHYQAGSGTVGNQPPGASFTATPNPVQAGATVTFDGSGSSDPDGSIAKYEWDLDGDGTYETDTGATKTVTRAYAASGAVTVRLRVTDNGGATATATRTVTVNPAATGPYSSAVLGTAGLTHYWRLGERSGTALVDGPGGRTATLAGGATLGAAGAPVGDSDTAVAFDGIDDAAAASVDLSATSTLTVEFWLKWNAYANDDRLAMEFTSNFNQQAGGFIVDPNDASGTFAVGIGLPGSRNTVRFTRPSTGVWHHYAFALDSGASAAQQVIPYVDGVPVAYTKPASGTGAGSFANAALNLMSRGGSTLFGAGTLDELAVYDQIVPAATIRAHHDAGTGNQAPTASFAATPAVPQAGEAVTFDATASSDPDGSIAKYEWDLDGDGTYETDSGTSRTVTRTYPTGGNITVRLRVTDDGGATGTTTKTLSVNRPPIAAFTAAPNPASPGQAVGFNAAGSSDPDGSITRYQWDLDGNGTFETDTGTTPTATTTYNQAGTVTVKLRVTDDRGGTAEVTRGVSVTSTTSGAYEQSVLATPGLRYYWRMGERSGSVLGDATGNQNATLAGGPTLGVAGAIADTSDTAVGFDGIDDLARASLNLTATSQVTVEFWLKWDAYANDDRLAMEFTSNFNQQAGGFIVDPNDASGSFAAGIGRSTTRNNVLFARPSAGAWHHYAFVLDSTAPAAGQVTPYVDGIAVPYTKSSSRTGAGAFAAATLNFMSRNGASLFGRGTLDEVAVYDRAVPAATIADHVAGGAGGT